MPLSFTANFTQKSYNWTQWKTVYNSKGGVYQFYDDGTSTTIYFYDGPEIHVAVIWDGTVPQGIISGGYSQAQNNTDLTDFQTNWQAGGNKRISRSDNGIPVLSNSSVTASSNTVFTGFGNREIALVINVKNAPTGTNPTLQFTLQEVDAGDQTTILGTSVTGASINAAGTQEITLNLTISNTVKISWTIGGTASPTFTGVYATIVTKSTTVVSGIDNTGTERYVAVKAASTAAVAADQSLVVAYSPNTPQYSKAPSGSIVPLITDAAGAQIVSMGANQYTVQSNATVTTSSSTIITTNDFGTQQINLIVNITGSITGTTPTITYAIQEVDPGNGTTTMGNSASTAAINATGVYTISLPTTTSNVVQVSWTVTGTTPSFGGVYTTVVSKVTPATQTTSTTSTSSTPGIGLGYITTTSKTNVALQSAAYNEQSANFTGSIVSASANDTSAGTGARTVTIYWMNAAGTTIGTETATLNGTTAVNLVTTTKCFIEKITVNTVGSGGSNAGNITLFTGAAGAGTAVAVIVTGDNRTFIAHHYVLSGKTCHVTDFTGVTNSSNQSLFSIQSAVTPTANQVSIQISDWVTGSQASQTQRTFSSGVSVVGPARLQMFVAPGSTSSMISYGSFTFYDQ